LSAELEIIGAEIIELELKKIVIRFAPDKTIRSLIKGIISENEVEITLDKEVVLAEQVKWWVIAYVWDTDQQENISNYLVDKMSTNYDFLNRTFSIVFEQTIERHHTLLKIERAKELIEDNELSFSRISYILGYQNLSTLSRQFKSETGMTMNEFRKALRLKMRRRRFLKVEVKYIMT
jgi:YesN/AraC family two-component response regulator